MNIITIPYGGKFHYIKPDTSYNRDRNDYFCLEDITELAVVPFIYIRMEKSAKSVLKKFASRYYNKIGYGIRLSAPSILTLDNKAAWWLANSLDNATYFGEITDITNVEKISQEVAEWIQKLPCKTSSETIDNNLLETINSAIESISKYTFLKIGDCITLDILSETTYTIQKETKTHIKLNEIEFDVIW